MKYKLKVDDAEVLVISNDCGFWDIEINGNTKDWRPTESGAKKIAREMYILLMAKRFLQREIGGKLYPAKEKIPRMGWKSIP